IIPAACGEALHRDVIKNTLELEQITGIGARRMVRGRLAAAATRSVLTASVLAPFVVASFLFGGIELVWVLVWIYVLLLGSVCACAVCVFLGALSTHRKKPGRSVSPVIGLAFIFPLMGLMSGGWEPLRRLLTALLRTSSPAAALALCLGGGSVLAALAIMFLNAASTNCLTFKQDRSSARTKLLALLIALALFALLLGLGGLFGGGSDIALMTFEVFSCLLIGGCCFGWIIADTHVPARHRARLEPRGPLARLLYLPLRNGASSTAVYLLLSMGMVGVCAVLLHVSRPGRMAPLVGGPNPYAFYPVPLTVTYVLYFSALTHCITRLLPRRFRTSAARTRVMALLLVFNLVLIAVVIGALGWQLEELTCGPLAFLPVLYVVSLQEPVRAAAFLSHMVGPFQLGFTYHLVLLLREAPGFGMAARAEAPSPARAAAGSAEGG
ncbi:MAG: hypothetical protein KAX19_11310, partial [Candidatus Brocadiae bacterium]|nr:hypothetical protein [Candidatus Brocadiia bacterium]